MKINSKELKNALDAAYEKAGNNAYFSNGFNAGVNFGMDKVLEKITQRIYVYKTLKKTALEAFKNDNLTPHGEKKMKQKLVEYDNMLSVLNQLLSND